MESLVKTKERSKAKEGSPEEHPDSAPPPPEQDTPERESRSVLTTLSEIRPVSISWIWYPWVARGKLLLLVGKPGTNKTTLTHELAARVSRGLPMPLSTESECAPADVILLSCEDSLADVVVPRLITAGADMRRVHVCEDPVQIPKDIPILESAIQEKRAALVVIDTMTGSLSDKLDSHRDQDVRHALIPLGKMAERLGVAVVFIVHMNKQLGGDAIERTGGSIAFPGVARIVLMLGKAKDDEHGRVLACVKSNLTARPRSLRFRVVQGEHPLIEWVGATEESADDLCAAVAADATPRAVRAAVNFVKEALAAGPMPTKELEEQARVRDISQASLRRARDSLAVQWKRAGSQVICWLPDPQAEDGERRAQVEQVEPAPAPEQGEQPVEQLTQAAQDPWRESGKEPGAPDEGAETTAPAPVLDSEGPVAQVEQVEPAPAPEQGEQPVDQLPQAAQPLLADRDEPAVADTEPAPQLSLVADTAPLQRWVSTQEAAIELKHGTAGAFLQHCCRNRELRRFSRKSGRALLWDVDRLLAEYRRVGFSPKGQALDEQQANRIGIGEPATA